MEGPRGQRHVWAKAVSQVVTGYAPELHWCMKFDF